MRKIKEIIMVTIMTSLSFITACQPITQPNGSVMKENVSEYNSKTTIRGKAEFPQSSTFTTKSILSDIVSSATISLIYPSDISDPSLRDTTIATGLTKNDGSFLINPDSSFLPVADSIYILEAAKK